jgi:hypothetical protein
MYAQEEEGRGHYVARRHGALGSLLLSAASVVLVMTEQVAAL